MQQYGLAKINASTVREAWVHKICNPLESKRCQLSHTHLLSPLIQCQAKHSAAATALRRCTGWEQPVCKAQIIIGRVRKRLESGMQAGALVCESTTKPTIITKQLCIYAENVHNINVQYMMCIQWILNIYNYIYIYSSTKHAQDVTPTTTVANLTQHPERKVNEEIDGGRQIDRQTDGYIDRKTDRPRNTETDMQNDFHAEEIAKGLHK